MQVYQKTPIRRVLENMKPLQSWQTSPSILTEDGSCQADATVDIPVTHCQEVFELEMEIIRAADDFIVFRSQSFKTGSA